MNVEILVAPNEDGFGPSSLAYHIVRAFRELRPNYRITVGTKKKNVNDQLYEFLAQQDSVQVDGEIDNNYLYPRRGDGQIDRPALFQKILDYRRTRDTYIAEKRLRERPNVRLVVDIGVPMLAAAASQADIPCFTFLDHSWSLTYQHLWLDDQLQRGTPAGSLVMPEGMPAALELLRSDEAAATKVYLASKPVTCDTYLDYWARLCGEDRVRRIGLLGGPLDDAGELNIRREARTLLDLENDPAAAVVISAGGTGVWRQLVPALLSGFMQKENKGELEYHVFIFIPAVETDDGRRAFTNAGIPVLPGPLRRSTGQKRLNLWPIEGSRRIHIIGDTWNCSYQEVIAGVDLIVSRAGGATVNDALVWGIPMLLIPEPGHWQVELIHRATVDGGYALSAPWDHFQRDPAGSIHARFSLLKPLWNLIRERMTAPETFQRRAEWVMVEEILGATKL